MERYAGWSVRQIRQAASVKGKWQTLRQRDLRQHPEWLQNLFDLVATAYAGIGGHLKLQRPEDLLTEVNVWTAVDMDTDDLFDAVRVGKRTPAGVKGVGMGHDGTPGAKEALVKQVARSLKRGGNFSEMSDAIAHLMITRHQVPWVGREMVEKVLAGKTIEWVGPHPAGKYPGYDGWYWRSIGGQRKLKIMLGRLGRSHR